MKMVIKEKKDKLYQYKRFLNSKDSYCKHFLIAHQLRQQN